jgi:hypothetical protein
MVRQLFALFGLVLVSSTYASAQGTTVALGAFRDGPHDGRIARASGFVCPDRVGPYIRDAAGQSGMSEKRVFCSYYALDGIYGTVRILPLKGKFDGPGLLAGQFSQEAGSGGRVVDQKTRSFHAASGLLRVFTRTYETSHLENLHYRVSYASAPALGWVVEVISEYASPRDDATKAVFLNWVYGPGLATLQPRQVAGASPARQ